MHALAEFRNSNDPSGLALSYEPSQNARIAS